MSTVAVPNIARVAQKWARRAASASGEYEDGVRSTTKSWAQNTQAAEKNYQAGVTAAAAQGRFGKGVQRAGDTKWKRNAAEKGPARFAQGVGIAEPDYAGQMGPVLEAISRVDLPPKGPRGSEANYQRVASIGKALHSLRIGK